jgi:hypothetical protein
VQLGWLRFVCTECVHHSRHYGKEYEMVVMGEAGDWLDKVAVKIGKFALPEMA